ncbi:hypothetical protein [Cohnella sp. GCM10027633]|uniref:hypothetical protein n=1 Tax=unclassified Cohnella TaxID=2636738 RepID=UPI00362B9818
MNMPEESRCAVKRTGIVLSAGPDGTLLEIEGKQVAVPAAKRDPSVRTGDRVGWNGERWIVLQDEVGIPGGTASGS